MSEPKRSGLLELLGTSQGCQFVIPVYQRNYTWKADDQVKQYFSDLENVLQGNYKNHFLGIIIYLEKSIDFSTRELSIIDGQQRLTTTFLLIYAVKEILVKNNETDMVNQLEGQYLTNPYHADKIKYKLKPLVSDDNVYRCIVEGRMDEIDDVSSNVFKNFQYMSVRLENLIQKGYTANQILMAMNKLYVVCVPISDEDNAQKIFESINTTGVKLTAADLIRNFLLMDLQSEVQEDYYIRYWKKLEEYISSDSKTLEMFFRMFLAIKKFTLIPKNGVYREFIEWVKKNGFATKDLFDELLIYAKIFHSLIHVDINKLDKNMRASIIDFRKINSDLPLPIAMEFYRFYKDGQISPAMFADLILSINSYWLRRSLCDMNSQNISKLFPTLLKKITEKCDGDYTGILGILNQEMVGNNAGTSGSYMPTDKQMFEALHLANVYKRPALRIVLDRMELHNNPAPVDLSKLSVEHLMPQTPSEEWLEELNTDMETYQANLHRLGNLTLATKPDNSKMGNLTWDYKNAILQDTAHLTINIELLKIKRWDLEQIEKRTGDIIARICELYPYPDVKIADTGNDIVDEKEALKVCLKYAVGDFGAEAIRKGMAYKSGNGENGYIIASSKMYVQGDKEKFWFGYREKRFAPINECNAQYLVLGCRNRDTLVIRFPKSFVDSIKERLNTSVDANGDITHYHIVILKNPDGHVSMLLSKPILEEIDVSTYVVGEG